LLRELRLLQLNPEARAEPSRVGLPASIEHLHIAGIRREQPFEDLDRRRLAGAVRTEQTEALAARNVEIEAVHGGHFAVPFEPPSPPPGRVAHADTLHTPTPTRSCTQSFSLNAQEPQRLARSVSSDFSG